MRFKQLFFKNEANFKIIFNELFEYSTDFVWQMVKNADDTEDIVQASFIKLYKRIDRFNEKSSLKTYFTRILINTCLDHFKKKKVEIVDIELIKNMSDTSEPENVNLDTFLNELSPQHHLCLSLFYYQSMPIKEIANQLNVSEGTIKSHLSRGRDELKKRMGKNYVD